MWLHSHSETPVDLPQVGEAAALVDIDPQVFPTSQPTGYQPAHPFHTKKREDISNSPAFNGKASARERRDTMEASWAIATSVSA